MLDADMLMDLEDQIRENLTAALVHLNQEERLPELFEILGMADILEPEKQYDCIRNGKIIILGQCEVPTHNLEGIAKSLGIDKNRFEFYLDYEGAKRFDPRHIHWRTDLYSLVIVGRCLIKAKESEITEASYLR